jgi:hypothetical protein
MATLTTRSGVLATAQGATGPGVNVVEVGTNLLALHLLATAGTLTWTVEQSLDGGVTWAPVCDPGTAVAATDVPLAISMLNRSAAIRIDHPVGMYRTNVTAFTSGAFTAMYMMGPDRQ